MAFDSAKRFRERHPARWKAIQKRSREKRKDVLRAQNDAWRRTDSGRITPAELFLIAHKLSERVNGI